MQWWAAALWGPVCTEMGNVGLSFRVLPLGFLLFVCLSCHLVEVSFTLKGCGERTWPKYLNAKGLTFILHCFVPWEGMHLPGAPIDRILEYGPQSTEIPTVGGNWTVLFPERKSGSQTRSASLLLACLSIVIDFVSNSLADKPRFFLAHPGTANFPLWSLYLS